MNKFLQIFEGEDGRQSSKRWCGVLGMAILFGCYVYCCIEEKEMPSATEFLAGACVALLGVESFTNIFKKNEES